MVYIRSRKFCCCIPVRFGVFILSLLGVAGGLLVSIAGWVRVSQLWTSPLPTSDTVALWLHAGIFTLLTVLSLFGFIGCFSKSPSAVNAYGVGLIIFLGLSVCSGAFTLYALFHQNAQDLINTCLNGATDSLSQIACNNDLNVYKGLAVTLYIVIWLLIIYAYVIVDNYVEQLEDEMSVKDAKRMIGQPVVQTVVQPSVAVPTYASFGGAPARENGYNHSHGIRGNNSVV